jgi:hypothetical protein
MKEMAACEDCDRRVATMGAPKGGDGSLRRVARHKTTVLKRGMWTTDWCSGRFEKLDRER